MAVDLIKYCAAIVSLGLFFGMLMVWGAVLHSVFTGA